MSKLTKAQIEKRDDAREYLRDILPVGSTVNVIVVHVSKSGMQREIMCLASVNGEVRNITHSVAKAIESRVGKRDGVVMGGCGMDMGFALVYELSMHLHGTKIEGAGYTIKHNWV